MIYSGPYAVSMDPRHIFDMTIKCEGIEYPVHKALVCTRSAYFEAMFSHDMQESRNGCVMLDNDDPQAVQSMIRFFYDLDYPFLRQTLVLGPQDLTSISNDSHEGEESQVLRTEEEGDADRDDYTQPATPNISERQRIKNSRRSLMPTFKYAPAYKEDVAEQIDKSKKKRILT